MSIKNLNLWQTALGFSVFGVALFLFSADLGILEEGFLGILLGNGISVFVLGASIFGMILSVILFKEFRFANIDSNSIISGFLGGILIGFGMGMISGGPFREFFGMIPFLSLSGFISALFIIIGLYLGDGFGGNA